MQKTLISLALFAAPLAHAQVVMPDVKKKPISLLPTGSVLKDVLVPRYDEDMNLVGDLKAEVLTLIDEKRIEGKNVRIRFYLPDGSVRGNISLNKADFSQTTSQLHANEPVAITIDNLLATGSGLAYDFQNGEGFLIGPATTRIKPDQTTSMNKPSNTAPAMALALLSTVAPPLTSYAAPPAFVSEAEIAAIQSKAESLKPTIDAATSSSEKALKEAKEKSETSSQAAHAFLQKSGLETVASEKSNTEPATEPLKIEPNTGDTVIEFDQGMYFDMEGGVLVYMGNVKITDPRFALTGANELKVFFKQEKTEKQSTGKDNKIGAKFGKVQNLTATGAVRILQKSVDGKEPIEASGAILSYNVPKGEIIISGGFPWVKQGKFYARAKEANLTLRLMNDGSFSTEGNWEMGGQLNLNQ